MPLRQGVVEVFITELLGIDVLYPEGTHFSEHAEEFPEELVSGNQVTGSIRSKYGMPAVLRGHAIHTPL